MELRGTRCTLRPWQRGDEAALPALANDRSVWRNLRDQFPHPYTGADAAAWIARCEAAQPPAGQFAILAGGALAGGVGFMHLPDVFSRTVELGYWLGRGFRGHGIATEAVGLIVPYIWRQFDVERIQAGVYAWNPSSARVLEKCGFTFEGRLRRHVYKDGEFTDCLLYARLREN